ncbi:MAG TPA: hypothetical protein VGN42_09145 [Pirellulales bacterium]|nr:hypothetical protein [Pirellulales bacterium]
MLRAAIATLLTLFASPAIAQRTQFPTPVDPASPFYQGSSPAASLNGTVQPVSPGYDLYASPSSQPPMISPYQQPGVTPGAPGAPPYGSQAVSPYGTYGQNPYSQHLPDGTLAPRTRFLNELLMENTYLARFGKHGFGIDDVGLAGAFAFPVLANWAPVFVTPGFTYHSWNGPASGNFRGFPDLPPNAYDAYLDTSWRPQITSWFSADLDVRVGVYSDFSKINSQSVRILGRGLGIVTFSPQWQVAAGVWYLDRLTVKLLPAGGVIWTPNQDTRFALLFPNPKISQRLTTIRNTDVWGYVAGEYGGGKWTVARANGAGDVVEYNDLRALLGLEWFNLSGARGHFEVGYVFDRHIIYRSGTPTAKPSDTVLLRAGLTF